MLMNTGTTVPLLPTCSPWLLIHSPSTLNTTFFTEGIYRSHSLPTPDISTLSPYIPAILHSAQKRAQNLGLVLVPQFYSWLSEQTASQNHLPLSSSCMISFNSYLFFLFFTTFFICSTKKQKSLNCGCKKYSIRTLIIVQLSTFWANPAVLSGRLGDIVPPACPRLSLGPPPSVTYPVNLTREASRGHPNKKLEPPCLAPCDAEESECRPLVSVLPCCLSLPRVLEHGWRQDVDRWVNQEHFCSAASSPWRAGAKSASLLKQHWFTWPSRAPFSHHWRERPLVGLLHLGQDLIPDLERAPHAFLAEDRGLRCWVSSQQLHTLLQTASVRAENDSWSIMKPTETHIL